MTTDSSTTTPTETPAPVPAEPAAPPASWDSLGLAPESLALVKQAGYTIPSPVQAQSIPIALERHDLVASAQTGTGKTAAFVLPMVERFAGRSGTFGLVLAPTREIAQQIEATIKLFGGPRGVTSAVLIGGVDMRHDMKALEAYPQILVATPGRLCDHLDRGNIWLDYIEVVVLDEADRMLDMGFSDQLSRIMEDVPKSRQTLLFSATITPVVKKLADRILHEPKAVTIGRPLSSAGTVEQRVLWLKEEAKNRELQRLLRRVKGSVIVFTRSKDGATRVWRSLHSAGFYDATYIHSDRLQSHRESALAEFKSGKFRVMVATDVAARGLHIDGVEHVVNYDLPMEAEDYVHRIGRTGRAGATGHATTFATTRDRRTLAEIEKLINKKLPEEFTDSHRSHPAPGEEPEYEARGGRGGDRGGRGGDRGRGGPSRGGSDRGASGTMARADRAPMPASPPLTRKPGPSPVAPLATPIIGTPIAPGTRTVRSERELESREGFDDTDEGGTEGDELTAAEGSTGAPQLNPDGTPRKRRRRRRGKRSGGAAGGPVSDGPSGAPSGS